MAVRHPHGEPSDLIRSVSRALAGARGRRTDSARAHGQADRPALRADHGHHLPPDPHPGLRGLRDPPRGRHVRGGLGDRRPVPGARGRLPRAGQRRRGAAAGRRQLGLQPLPRHLRQRPGRARQVSAEGPQSPYLEDLVSGFDDGAHATALGKALLATLTPDQRLRYLKDWGMRSYTSATLTQPEALEADLTVGDRRGMQVEISQFRSGVGCAGRDRARRPRSGTALRAGVRDAGRPAAGLGPGRAEPPGRSTARTIAKAVTTIDVPCSA